MSFKEIHTCSHICTCRHALHTLSYTFSHTLYLTDRQTHTHLLLTHPSRHSHTFACSVTHTYSHTHLLTHTNTFSHTHTHTHTHTSTRSNLSLSKSPPFLCPRLVLYLKLLLSLIFFSFQVFEGSKKKRSVKNPFRGH